MRGHSSEWCDQVRIAFPYEGLAAVDVPDSRLMAVVGPCGQMVSAPADGLIRDALEHPLGGPRLRELGRGRRRVLILVSSASRVG